jgi:hypothetical protein
VKVLLKYITALAITFSALIFAPYLICLPWHLTHRSNQQLGNYKIHVPFPYFVTWRGSTANIWRMRTIPNMSLYTFGRLEFRPRSIPMNLSAWSQLAKAEASRNSASEATQYDISIGSTPGHCQEIAPEIGGTSSSLLCRGADSTTALYLGDFRNIAEVKQILSTALTNTGGTQ